MEKNKYHLIILLFTLSIPRSGLAQTPDMVVRGNGVDIANGDMEPRTADFTDFGATSTSVTRLFYIDNIGDPYLILNDSPRIVFTGDNAGDFSVVPPLPDDIIGDESAGRTYEQLWIQFVPGGIGQRNATVNIYSNDPDDNPYQFAVRGWKGNPEIDIQGNGFSIPSGDNSPSETDGTEFGYADKTGGTVVHTFTIGNSGFGNLTLNGTPTVLIEDLDSGDPPFAVTKQPATPVGPTKTTTFQITFDPAAYGLFTAKVTVQNNDGDESNYWFHIRGNAGA